MRATLNAIYKGSGLLAGFFLVGIALMSLAQVVGRLFGYAAHSFDEFAGYCMAASSFLGLAWTLRASEHIRVTLAIGRAKGAARRAIEIACLLVAAVMSGYFAWACIDMTWTSFKLDDVSQGLVPIKLWIPQSAMAIGLTVLFLAFVDDLIAVLRGREASYELAEAARSDATPAFER